MSKFLKRHKIKVFIIVLGLVAYYFCLPDELFKDPTSTVVSAKNKDLLGAVIASDGQWRFPEISSVPKKFEQCILQFEDAYFYRHFGFNPVSIFKALVANVKAGKVVRGGSTISQQVIRLSRKNKKRSYIEKLKELILATRLEFRYSKEEILKLYLSNAPFGGNVVGLEMAAWRYFGLEPKQLSWAESATLAVLPNSPSLIYPGKNQHKLKEKRDKLLKKLYRKHIIDSLTCSLALEESLPKKPYKLPQIASHLVGQIAKKYRGKRIQSSVDIHLQKRINQLVKRHYLSQKQNEVYNMSVLVLDVKTRKVLAYVANSPTDIAHQKNVNNIISLRSTGSTLKPFLYAHMLQSGALLPTQLEADVPTKIAGYSPKNYNLTFSGAVPANQALTRSLNIPAVLMLKKYGLEKFYSNLKDYRIRGINKPPDYYGLSLILGGSEASLWDLCKTYAGYAGIVNHYEILGHKYYKGEFAEPTYLKNKDITFGQIQNTPEDIDAGSAFLTLNTLTEVNRPLTDQAWKYYDSSQKIAWKTGTSFGNKDAWSIGVTPKYVVGVWVGNSDGEGRPELTGIGSAAPLMFDVFDILPKSDWFLEPLEDMITQNICSVSGYLALPICKSVVKRVQKSAIKAKPCPYHISIQVDKTEQYRVNLNCESSENTITKTWFVLPALMAYYYRQNNSSYRRLPSFRSDCSGSSNKPMAFVYPTKYRSEISLTKGTDGRLNPLILKLVHSNSQAKVYWYIDDVFERVTEQYHELAIRPNKGEHKITVVDNLGNELRRIVTIN